MSDTPDKLQVELRLAIEQRDQNAGEIEALTATQERLEEALQDLGEERNALLERIAQGIDTPPWKSPGHFYSPIPGSEDIARELETARRHHERGVCGIDMRHEHQMALANTIATAYKESDLAGRPEAGRRYYADNDYCAGAPMILGGRGWPR